MSFDLKESRDSSQSVIDACQLSLREVQSELQLLSTLFEHLRVSHYGADSFTGTSVTLRRLSIRIVKVVKRLEKIY